MPLTDLRLTSCRLGSHSVDFVSLRSPQHHLVLSASGVQDLKEYPFPGASFPFAGHASAGA